MTGLFCNLLLILSFISFVHPLPATSFVVPEYPRQLSLFTRLEQSKPLSSGDDHGLSKGAKDDLANWATYAVRVMAAKFNNTISTIKDKVKKSISNDQKTELFPPSGSFHKNKTNKNLENLKRYAALNRGLNMTLNHKMNATAKNVTEVKINANLKMDNVTKSETKNGNSKTENVDDKSDSLKIVQAERRQYQIHSLGNPSVFGTHFSLSDEPQNYQPVANYLSHLLGNTHYGLTGNKIIIQTPDYFAPAPTPAAYIPVLVQHPELTDLQSNQVVKNQFGGDTKKGNDLAALKLAEPSKGPASSVVPPTSTISASSTPTAPPTSSVPSLPSVPSVSSVPLVPSVPSISSAPSVSSVPSVPSVSYIPTVSYVPSVSFAPSVSSVPSVSSTPLASTVPSTSSSPASSTPSVPPTTSTSSPKSDVEYVSKPIKLVDASGESGRPSAGIRPIISVPFEAVITITRDHHSLTPSPSATPSLPITLNQDSRNYYEIVTRDPPDEFPPYFKVNDTIHDNRKIEEEGNQGKKKDCDKNNFSNSDNNNANNVNNDINSKKNKVNNIKNINNQENNISESSTVNVVSENEIPKKQKKKKEKNVDNFKQNKFLDDTFDDDFDDDFNDDFNDDSDDDDDFETTKKKKDKDKSRKRQTSVFKQLLQILGFSKKRNRDNNTVDLQITTTPVFKVFTANKFPGAKFENTSSNRGRRNQTAENNEIPDNPNPAENEVIPSVDEKQKKSNDTSEKQEFDDDDDDEEEGSLGSITDLLPLVIPVLEDLSDPDSDTDLAELLEGAIPLLQGLSEGENDDGTPIEIAATISPVIQAISAGKDGQDSDSGAILTPIITIAAPFIGPILGPLIGPLLRSSSNPHSEGSSVTAFIQSISAPLSKPTEPGGMSPLSQLVAGIVAGLSRESSHGGAGSDVGALISSVVSGTLAGTSAGLSGGSSKGSGHKYPPPHKPDSYGAYAHYGPAVVPASSVNTLQLLGSTLKDIFGASGTIVTSAIGGLSGLLGASSAGSSSEEHHPHYGPPHPHHDPPHSHYGPPHSHYSSPTYKPPHLATAPAGLKPPPAPTKSSNKSSKITFNNRP